MIIASADSTWTDVFNMPISERCGPAPADVIRHIAQVNAHRAETHTKTANADKHLLELVKQAMADMPSSVTQRLRDTFLGVYFATGIGSSAATDIVISPNSEFLGLITVLDIDAVSHTSANAWASWRERSPFDSSTALALEVQIAEHDDDHIRHAIQFLLLHELGHALSAGRSFLPDWWSQVPDHLSTYDFSYLPISWQIATDRSIVPLEANDFPLRRHIAHYDSGPQLPAAYMVDIYSALKQTSFPTLYSASSVHEDFADSFACYVHTVLLNKPLAVSIRQHGELVLHWRMDWRSDRYAEKYAFFSRLLGSAA
ncbi:hypothetical protein ACEN9F_02045 [Duganella sp. CT11-25]|uniref:hypothetical protein n=1 Tax=unclassified Duganella TaxID=2636909 RepID=UPI0039AF25C4